jgi:hypothetical protein
MLKPFIIAATDDTPKVVLDNVENIFEIAGRSLPEDAGKFYNPVIEWASKYVISTKKNTEIRFNLDYYNSSSARLIVKFLIEFEKLLDSKYSVNVIWTYKENDEVMKERGEEIKNVIKLPVVFETY